MPVHNQLIPSIATVETVKYLASYMGVSVENAITAIVLSNFTQLRK